MLNGFDLFREVLANFCLRNWSREEHASIANTAIERRNTEEVLAGQIVVRVDRSPPPVTQQKPSAPLPALCDAIRICESEQDAGERVVVRTFFDVQRAA